MTTSPASGKSLLAQCRRSANYARERPSSSSHVQVYSKTGQRVTIPVHGNHDLPAGTHKNIIRQMTLAGLLSLFIAAVAVIAAMPH